MLYANRLIRTRVNLCVNARPYNNTTMADTDGCMDTTTHKRKTQVADPSVNAAEKPKPKLKTKNKVSVASPKVSTQQRNISSDSDDEDAGGWQGAVMKTPSANYLGKLQERINHNHQYMTQVQQRMAKLKESNARLKEANAKLLEEVDALKKANAKMTSDVMKLDLIRATLNDSADPAQ